MKIEIILEKDILFLTTEELARIIWTDAIEKMTSSVENKVLTVLYPKHVILIATSVIDEHLDSMGELISKNNLEKVTIYVSSQDDKDDFIDCISYMFEMKKEIKDKFEVKLYG